MENQNFDLETLQILKKIEEEVKFILGKEYQKIEQEIKKDRECLQFLIN